MTKSWKSPFSGVAARITAIYAVFGVLWILLSDTALEALGLPAHTLNMLQTAKGWFFIAFTAALLYFLLKNHESTQSFYENTLKSSEERFRSLFEDHSAVKLLIDPDSGRIVDVNRAAVDFYGWPRDVLKSMRIQDINVLAPEEIKRRMEDAKARKKIHFDFTHRLADGSEREVAVFSSAVNVEGKALLHSIIHDITELKKAQQALQDSETLFQTLVEHAPDAIFVQVRGRFAYVNSAAASLFGIANPSDVLDQPMIERFAPEYREGVAERIRLLNQEKAVVSIIREVCLKMDGTPVEVEVSAVPISFKGEDGALVFARDVSERVEAETRHQALEAKLLQSQKMEAVGRLAGGVAHDYNNMLSVIMGYAELALTREEKLPNAVRDDLEEILKAATRSIEITRQLLAFARKQTISPRVIDLNETAESTLKMLRRLVGENIQLTWNPGAGLWKVKLDPSQIDQVLANLCVNARDAIADVGVITIKTGNATFTPAFCRENEGFLPGDYVELSVGDNGCGMAPETLAKVFEPFFTTKPLGQGTGLGLATVYGIVSQNSGFIKVDTQTGAGTTFKIYLPRYEGEEEGEVKARETGEIPTARGETVLVVEDEKSLLKLTRTMLESLGYLVLPAGGAEEALSLAEKNQGEIPLLISDVVMPTMNGKDLAAKIQALHPETKVIFMSGYTADILSGHQILNDSLNFLQKPINFGELAAKVRKVLDGK